MRTELEAIKKELKALDKEVARATELARKQIAALVELHVVGIQSTGADWQKWVTEADRVLRQ